GPGLRGLLEDELALARAELVAFEKTRKNRYLQRARQLSGFIRLTLLDPQIGAYMVRPPSRGDAPEDRWPSIDPDLTAAAALILDDKAAQSWAATHPELIEP